MPTFFSLTDEPLSACIRVGNIPGKPGYVISINETRFATTADFKIKVESTPGFKELTAEEQSFFILKTYMMQQ